MKTESFLIPTKLNIWNYNILGQISVSEICGQTNKHIEVLRDMRAVCDSCVRFQLERWKNNPAAQHRESKMRAKKSQLQIIEA